MANDSYIEHNTNLSSKIEYNSYSLYFMQYLGLYCSANG